MTKTVDTQLTEQVRLALQEDPQLSRLLGGEIEIGEVEAEPTPPHIKIAESRNIDWGTNREISGESTLTLQLWPCTGDRLRAEELLNTTQHALEKAGMLQGKRPIQLYQQYSGSRRIPDSRDLHCVLRYRAIRRGEAA